MIFLIQYDRMGGHLLRFEKYAYADRKRAKRDMLELDLKLNREGLNHEVVILEAADEAAVRRTHRRYFETLEQLLTAPA